MCQNKLCHAEPALYYWHTQDDFFEFFPIVLSKYTCRFSALVAEEANSSVCHSLNAPWVWRRFRAVTWVPSKHTTTAKILHHIGKRFWLRVRRRSAQHSYPHHHVHWRSVRTSSVRVPLSASQVDHKKSWHILFTLAQESCRSFRRQRSLRSNRFSLDEILALRRQGFNITEPDATRVTSLLLQTG